MTATASPAATGRREKRREAILSAARRLFLDRGFDAVSVAEIVRESGGSLSTLYDLFDNKEGILAAVAIDNHTTRLATIQQLADVDGASPRETLGLLVRGLQHEMFAPESIGIIRILMAEALRNPQIAKLLDESANLAFSDMLISLFESWTRQGRARIDRPGIAADLLIGMLIHGPLKCRLERIDPDDREATARAAVAMFADHYAIA